MRLHPAEKNSPTCQRFLHKSVTHTRVQNGVFETHPDLTSAHQVFTRELQSSEWTFRDFSVVMERSLFWRWLFSSSCMPRCCYSSSTSQFVQHLTMTRLTFYLFRVVFNVFVARELPFFFFKCNAFCPIRFQNSAASLLCILWLPNQSCQSWSAGIWWAVWKCVHGVWGVFLDVLASLFRVNETRSFHTVLFCQRNK